MLGVPEDSSEELRSRVRRIVVCDLCREIDARTLPGMHTGIVTHAVHVDGGGTSSIGASFLIVSLVWACGILEGFAATRLDTTLHGPQIAGVIQFPVQSTGCKDQRTDR